VKSPLLILQQVPQFRNYLQNGITNEAMVFVFYKLACILFTVWILRHRLNNSALARRGDTVRFDADLQTKMRSDPGLYSSGHGFVSLGDMVRFDADIQTKMRSILHGPSHCARKIAYRNNS
jgi:hypothetical protein